MKGLIEAINAENVKAEVPAFNVGDTVKVVVLVPVTERQQVEVIKGKKLVRAAV